MGTQAIISFVKDGKTFVKIIARCDGFRAENVAKELISYMEIGGELTTLKDIYDIARELKLGCEECLVVMNKDDIIYKGEDEDVESYREHFEDPKFNPRWINGKSDYLFIIPII